MNAPNTTTDDGNVAPAVWSVAVVGALLTLGSPIVFGVHAVVSTGVGAALATGNLWSLGRMVRSFLGASGNRRAWVPLGLLKLSVLFVLLGLIVRRGYVEVLPLAFGFLALPLGIVASQLRAAPPAQREN